MNTYPASWEIHPKKQPDLDYDDFHQGFNDASNRIYPEHPHNQAYMMGWLQSLGMDAGYTNLMPTINDENYLEGYEQAQFERICHTPSQPDIREIRGQVNAN
ncbi:hypothetical protein [Microcoleus sp. herbarium5]|uniref:hypothetical protein n=1 Tax=Microcoleus sp. herbarium5 TaxID=3055434 RepID=UPI002FCE7970